MCACVCARSPVCTHHVCKCVHTYVDVCVFGSQAESHAAGLLGSVPGGSPALVRPPSWPVHPSRFAEREVEAQRSHFPRIMGSSLQGGGEELRPTWQ